MNDHNDNDERHTPPSTEGVRILGAQEAIAFDAQRSLDDPEPLVGSKTGDNLSVWGDDGPSWSASPQVAAPTGSGDDVTMAMPAVVIDGSAGESPAMPHWSEPATGQMPAVFASSESADGSNDGGPRFRSDSDDWSDADFAAALARDDDDDLSDMRITHAEPAPLDAQEDDAAFVAAVRARRSAGTRAVVTSTPEARPRPAATGRRPNPPRRSAIAEELDGDMLPASGSGRNLLQAFATAAIFGTVAIVCFSLGRTYTALLTAAVLGVCAFEMCTALQSKGLRPATVPVVFGCAITPIVALKVDVVASAGASAGFGLYPMVVVGTLVTFSSMLWFLFKVGPGRPVVGIATSVMTYAYIGGLGGFVGLLLQRPNGIGLLQGTLLCVIAYDVAGYFVGSRIGNAKIAPDISPNKTVEGTIAGVLGALLMGLLALSNIAPWRDGGNNSLMLMAVTGFLIGVAALLGDLVESMLKRDLGVKDFGSVLPGHGGFLDRFDGLLFALPLAYFVSLHLNAF